MWGPCCSLWQRSFSIYQKSAHKGRNLTRARLGLHSLISISAPGPIFGFFTKNKLKTKTNYYNMLIKKTFIKINYFCYCRNIRGTWSNIHFVLAWWIILKWYILLQKSSILINICFSNSLYFFRFLMMKRLSLFIPKSDGFAGQDCTLKF